MTIHRKNIEAEPLERQAHHWLAQLVSGEATTADAESFKGWRNQSSDHEAAFAAALRRWKDFGPAGHALLEAGDAPVWSPPLVSRRALLGGIGVSAVVAGYGVVRPPLGLWPSLNELTADYRTATGEQRRIALAGNVSVQMNSQTSIAVPTTAADEITLISGEASFATTSQKDLVVSAGEGRAIANRARFDVRITGLSVCVTCFSGEVRIEYAARRVSIASKQQLRYDSDGLRPAVVIDPAEAAAWQDGILIFRLTPLSDVIAEINRYRPGKVILTNAALGKMPVNGRFQIQRIDDVLVWIEQAFGASKRALPAGIVLLS